MYSGHCFVKINCYKLHNYETFKLNKFWDNYSKNISLKILYFDIKYITLLTSFRPKMIIQIIFLWKLFVINFTDVTLLLCMWFEMLILIASLCKCFVTTFAIFSNSMCLQMSIQIASFESRRVVGAVSKLLLWWKRLAVRAYIVIYYLHLNSPLSP